MAVDWSKFRQQLARTWARARVSRLFLPCAGGLIVLLLILIGLRSVLSDPTQTMIGSELDSVQYLWGLWWFHAQMGTPQGLTGISYLANYPSGVRGMIMAPVGALLMGPILKLWGPVFAYNVVWVFNLALLAVGTAALARRVTGSGRAAVLAAVAVIVSRPPFFNVAMGQLHGASVGWLGLGAAMWWGGSRDWRRAFLGGCLMGLSLVESPYSLIPVFGCCAALGIFDLIRALKEPQARRTWLLGLGAAALGLILVSAPQAYLLLSSHASDLTLLQRDVVVFTGSDVYIPIFDNAEHRVRLLDFLNPFQRSDFSLGAKAVLTSGGGSYVGLIATCIALAGRRSRKYLVIPFAFMLISMGSTFELGVGRLLGIFGLINLVLAYTLQPLTMPDLFAIFVSMSLAVGAAMGAKQLLGEAPARWWGVIALLVLEGAVVGGPSLRIPGYRVGDDGCVATLIKDRPGPVHYIGGPNERYGPESEEGQDVEPASKSAAGLDLSDEGTLLPGLEPHESPPAASEQSASSASRSPASGSAASEASDSEAKPSESLSPESLISASPVPDLSPTEVAAAESLTSEGSPTGPRRAKVLWPADDERPFLLQVLHQQESTQTGLPPRWVFLGPLDPQLAALTEMGHPVHDWILGGQPSSWEWSIPVRWVLVHDPKKRLEAGPLGTPAGRCNDIVAYEAPPNVLALVEAIRKAIKAPREEGSGASIVSTAVKLGAPPSMPVPLASEGEAPVPDALAAAGEVAGQGETLVADQGGALVDGQGASPNDWAGWTTDRTGREPEGRSGLPERMETAGGGAPPDAPASGEKDKKDITRSFSDKDKDGIPDERDQCPDEAETVNGIQDADGCPESDIDQDGVPDVVDVCVEIAETVNGLWDEDGCPELDQDDDGILDPLDMCKAVAETKNGLWDDDGCPELDQDNDGILDPLDKCKEVAETKNGLWDEDGCPELDSDGDGIIDALDQCKALPENKNGFWDEDGCPEGDQDGDGIIDPLDDCKLAPETVNDLWDEDGCPELDSGGDGLPDTLDACPNTPETENGFWDEDGCPELDQDKDGVIDPLDECPGKPETINGLWDEDGCPELDRDKDGIVDALDACPEKPETKNGLWDEDGCPEADKDGDGSPDYFDKCPEAAETVNGFTDDDGCPDQLPDALVKPGAGGAGGPEGDQDGDGIPDHVDGCPTSKETWNGWWDDDGCPEADRDNDRVIDLRDMCPDEREVVNGFRDSDGCPEPDRDGDGVPSPWDRCPDEPETVNGFRDTDGCPEADSDGDNILDVLDRCPNAPENVNGFADADGCPEPDTDGDGLLDPLDKCPNAAETVNGIRDRDGCPELDADGDGVLDLNDMCPKAAETVNGFRDGDGCPEPDRDGDGIIDPLDMCPREKETKNGFQDTDGCPEPDRDGDGIIDLLDMCPKAKETKNGFQDADGCPEPDRDRDGIPDLLDACPRKPETRNGFQDRDGCPDQKPG